MNKLVSIIIPVCGVEDYIESCAFSLFRQTYPCIQFIFVNDATPDSSIDKLCRLIDSQFKDMREQILIINKEKNEGISQARKTGLCYAKGEYIMHVDPDDWIETDAVDQLMNYLKLHPLDLLYFDYYRNYSDHSEVCRERDYETKEEYLHSLMSFDAFGSMWNKIIRKEILCSNDVIYPVYDMIEDLVVSVQCVYYSERIGHLSKPLYHYRYNVNSISLVTDKRKQLRRWRHSMHNVVMLDHMIYRFGLGDRFEDVHADYIYKVVDFAAFHELKLLEEMPRFPIELNKMPYQKGNFVRQILYRIIVNMWYVWYKIKKIIQ